jgi:hypothetical protein
MLGQFKERVETTTLGSLFFGLSCYGVRTTFKFQRLLSKKKE